MNNSDVVIESAKEILNAVNSAVQTQQYSNLSSQIRSTVNTARSQIQSNNASQQNKAYQRQAPGGSAGLRYTNVSPQAERPTPFFQRHVSRSKGVGAIIGGIFGAFFTGIPALVFLLLWLLLHLAAGYFVGFALFGILTGLFVWLISRGVKSQKLMSRYFDYGKYAGDSEYLSIEKLSKMTGVRSAQIVSDIKQMQQLDMLSYAVFDKDESTLMLTPEAYQEYSRLQAEREAFENEQAAQKKELSDSDLPEDVKTLLSEGQAYLLNVRNYNDEIPDTEPMSGKLYELENIMKRIFEQVRKDPSRAKELRKFMTYYLPTTDKLLASYVAACKQGTEGENIRTTKSEIESAMDVINDAFEHLLDKMFEDTAWDVSSDISVMKSMMAQDGLTTPEKEKVKVPV